MYSVQHTHFDSLPRLRSQTSSSSPPASSSSVWAAAARCSPLPPCADYASFRFCAWCASIVVGGRGSCSAPSCGRIGRWRMTCDVWRVTYDVWRMTRDIWHVTYGASRNGVTRDAWRVTRDAWRVTRDAWRVTRDVWRVTCDVTSTLSQELSCFLCNRRLCALRRLAHI